MNVMLPMVIVIMCAKTPTEVSIVPVTWAGRWMLTLLAVLVSNFLYHQFLKQCWINTYIDSFDMLKIALIVILYL